MSGNIFLPPAHSYGCAQTNHIHENPMVDTQLSFVTSGQKCKRKLIFIQVKSNNPSSILSWFFFYLEHDNRPNLKN